MFGTSAIKTDVEQLTLHQLQMCNRLGRVEAVVADIKEILTKLCVHVGMTP